MVIQKYFTKVSLIHVFSMFAKSPKKKKKIYVDLGNVMEEDDLAVTHG